MRGIESYMPYDQLIIKLEMIRSLLLTYDKSDILRMLRKVVPDFSNGKELLEFA